MIVTGIFHTPYIVEVDSNPSIDGLTAPIGAFAVLTTGIGAVWHKVGSSDTAWNTVAVLTNNTASAVTISTNANTEGNGAGFARNNHTHQLTSATALLDHVPQYSSADWVATYPETLLDQSRATMLKEDWIGPVTGQYTWISTISGGSSIVATDTTLLDGNHTGIVRITGGNAAARYSNLTLLNTLRLGNSVVNITVLFQIATTTNALFRLGLGDLSTNVDYNNGVYLEYNSATSANWLIKTANASSRTSTTTAVAATANAWHKLVISINAAATSVSYTLDDVSLGTITTNIPTAVVVGPVLLSNSVAATVTSMFVDYYSLTQRFTTPR